MARRRGAGEPIHSLELLQMAILGRRPERRAEAEAWVAEHVEDIEAYAAGAPCADGRDGRQHAAELLELVSDP